MRLYKSWSIPRIDGEFGAPVVRPGALSRRPNIRVFHATNGTVFSVVPGHQFRAKIRNQTEDFFNHFLIALGFLEDSEIRNKRWISWGWQYNFYRWNSKVVHDYINCTIPLYFPDELKSHFRITSELFTRMVKQGHGHISRSLHVLSHYWMKLVETSL